MRSPSALIITENCPQWPAIVVNWHLGVGKPAAKNSGETKVIQNFGSRHIIRNY